jgi:hypothetical protein
MKDSNLEGPGSVADLFMPLHNVHYLTSYITVHCVIFQTAGNERMRVKVVFVSGSVLLFSHETLMDTLWQHCKT